MDQNDGLEHCILTRLMAVGFVLLATSGPVAAKSIWEVELA
jgi:hypothetical protein